MPLLIQSVPGRSKGCQPLANDVSRVSSMTGKAGSRCYGEGKGWQPLLRGLERLAAFVTGEITSLRVPFLIGQRHFALECDDSSSLSLSSLAFTPA